MGRPRPPVGPTVDLAFSSFKAKIHETTGYDDVVAWVRDLLPELMGRGVVDLVES